MKTTMVHRSTNRIKQAVLAAAAVLASIASATAGPINTDVAFTPRAGGGILRLQYVYLEADGHGAVGQINASTFRSTLVYGATERVALFFSVPYQNRQIDVSPAAGGRFEDAHDGIGDMTALVKYRFWQRDSGTLETNRWAVLGGVSIRSGDSDFTTDSYDPIIGTAWSRRANRTRWDADLLYRFGTGSGQFGHDAIRYDLAWSYRIYPAIYEPGQIASIDTVAELNGLYRTDGSHEVYLSPGLQLSGDGWVLETSLQLPIIREVDDDRAENDFRFVFGIRFHW
ncbi:MAG: transporter [Planctomycetes bacterium]|nr:transporter [Planctomycetota bacterium]